MSARFREDGKTVWKNVGDDAKIAQAQQLQIGRVLLAQMAAEAAGTEKVEAPGRVHLRSKSKEYIERQIARGKKRAAVTFGTAIEEFIPIVKAQFRPTERKTHQSLVRSSTRKEHQISRSCVSSKQQNLALRENAP